MDEKIIFDKFQCKICQRKCKNYASLSTHVNKMHRLSKKEYVLHFEYNDIIPLCKCGCGNETNFLRHKFGDFINGHNSFKSSGLKNNFFSKGYNVGNATRANNMRGKTYKEIYGIEKAENIKKKKITTAIEMGRFFPNIGTNEDVLLKEQEIKDNCKIIKQYRVPNTIYRVDGYCKETNTVYEVYEFRHKYKIEKDLKRQKEIENYLGCKFVIIWDKKNNNLISISDCKSN